MARDTWGKLFPVGQKFHQPPLHVERDLVDFFPSGYRPELFDSRDVDRGEKLHFYRAGPNNLPLVVVLDVAEQILERFLLEEYLTDVVPGKYPL